jgi:eukaryotic-like serine/threonine-protein kinase
VTPARWSRMREVFGAALETPEPERPRFLESACAGDAELRAEVERLLAGNQETSWQSPAAQLFTAAAEFAPGDTVAHYRIAAKLGEGGMGVVYKAHDTHLDRFVAIKVLPPERVCDAGREARFIQEARAASALNHPNVVHIYDTASEKGMAFIAMEFIAGKTLDQAIPRKGMRLAEALKVGVQIADALSVAHAAGVIHRDLKPGNVMVTEHGDVKILDFGLAKLTERLSGANETTRTLDVRTEPGTLIGTVAYMSPEQAEGRTIDARSDIFSFGALLYEMVTGRRAFTGDSRMSTLASILRDDVKPVRDLVEDVPPELERIISRCLRKDASRRFQHMDDVKVALQEIKEESDSGKLRAAASPKKPAPRRWVRPSALVAATLCLGAAAIYLWRGQPARAPAPQVAVQLTRDRGLTAFPSLSSDGSLLAFASDRDGGNNLDIYVRQTAGGQSIRLTRDPADDYDAAISPDGTHVAFRSDRGAGGIYVVPTFGGEERPIATEGRRPRFSPDGQWILYWVGHPTMVARGGGTVYVVPAAGGVPRQLAASFPSAGFPVWAPTGTRVLFLGSKSATEGPHNWWVTPVESDTAIQAESPGPALYPELWTADGVVHAGAPGGDVVNLWQYPLSETTFKRTAEARQLTFGAGRQTQASVSAAGDIAFAAVSVATDLWMQPFDAGGGKIGGEPRPVTRDDSLKQYLRPSGDGRLLAYECDRGGKREIWIRDFQSGKETMVASGTAPRLSRDGKHLAYVASDGKNRAYYVVNLGDNVARKVEVPGTVWALSSGGSRVLAGSTGDALHSVDVATGRSTLLVPPGLYSTVFEASFSPDGRWVAFDVKTAPDLTQIFVVPYQDGVTPERGAWIAITGGRSWDAGPQWSPQGDTLYFPSERDGSRSLWGQRLDPATHRPAGAPFAVRRFREGQRGSMVSVTQSPSAVIGFAVAADKIVYSLTQVTGNIWMIKRQGR